MNKCINCGTEVKLNGRFVFCDACEKTGKEMKKLLRAGLTLDYSDGYVETLYLSDSKNFRVEE